MSRTSLLAALVLLHCRAHLVLPLPRPAAPSEFPARPEEFVLDGLGARLVHFPVDGEGCFVYDRREDVIRALARAGTKPMVMEDDTNFDLLLDECERRMRRKSKPETDDISNRVTFPGTKWCGPGNTASDIHDLGSYARTDACCRTHDLCPLSLAAGEHSPVMNLTNDSPFTLSHCLCDVHFKACLDGVGSMSSETVGRLFFNIGEMSCFRLDHPVVRCLKPSGSKRKNCEQYLLDVTQPPRWQIFANPSF